MSKPRSTLFAAVAAVFLGSLALRAAAHEGHHAPITKDVATKRGTLQIEKLVESGKLDNSWKSKATLQSADLRQKGDAKEWALVYTNPDAKEGERTLHVVLSESGKYLSVGFKGT